MNLGKFRVVDDCQHNGSRAQQLPGSFDFMAAISDQMKQLCKDRFRRHERQSKLAKCIDAQFVPSIAPVEER